MAGFGGIAGRLYRGEVSVNFVRRQRMWYSISGIILLVSVVAVAVRKLNFSVDFKGGSVFQFPATRGQGTATQDQIQRLVSNTGGGDSTVQLVSSRLLDQWSVTTKALSQTVQQNIGVALEHTFHLTQNQVAITFVGPTWGSQITSKALEALIIFLIVIVIYLSIAFEWRMAIAAFVALLHDIVITIGVYALTGFQVSPTTVIGLLTILGYSLYDTVVVFDKVRENTAGLLTSQRSTYSDAANLALNQTLVRSINTSLTALIPVASHPVRRGRPARRGNAQGPVAGAVRRHALRHLLVDLHRHPGAGRPQGAPARVQGPGGQGQAPPGGRPPRRRRGQHRGAVGGGRGRRRPPGPGTADRRPDRTGPRRRHRRHRQRRHRRTTVTA